MWTPGFFLILLIAGHCSGVTRDQFYPYGPGLDQRLPRGADVSSPEILLKVPIVFFGETYESIYVNNYGVLSFRSDIPSFLNAEFPLPYPSIAAFYSNIDTTETGAVYYRESNESYVLLKAEESVQNNFHEYYDFKPTSVFIASWIDVAHSKQRYERKNTFQIAVISNGTESFVELLYPEREIQWIQRETAQGELPDAKAQAGFISEDGRISTLRGSGSHQIRNIISWSNTQEPGKYVFRVGNIPIDGLVAVPDQYDQNEVEVAEESKTCAQSGPSVCHLQARCVDYQAGICCQCGEGFYGNGKTCIKNDIPIRVHGKVNGVINNENLNDVDIQAYVVVADGRSYTALSQAPTRLGGSLQLLNVLGGVIGWLFAKPSGLALNGYQLTGGVFNHTADILFPATGDRITITQEYFGQDVFDQISLDTDIRGNLPYISPGSNLEVSEYEEQYGFIVTGAIHSASERTFTDKKTGQKYVQRVTQTFSYSPCKFSPPSEKPPLTLKVFKNYLANEATEKIVRYGASNKIIGIGQEDPCIEGQNSCAQYSTCVAQGDSFTCVCQSGFTSIYYGDVTICADIDECEAGTHNCDTNADCYNHDGGFECRCRNGYEGDGISCNRESGCRSKVCDPNAQCRDNNVEEATCVCNPGYTGNGERCYDTTCSNCSPYAFCGFSDVTQTRQCQCNPGYIGDGYYCAYAYSSTTETYGDTTTVEYVTEMDHLQSTTFASSDKEYNEDFVLPNCDSLFCVCPPGYSSYKHRGNDLCRIDVYNNGDNNEEKKDNSIKCRSDTDCPPNAMCSFSPESYLSNDQEQGQCVCPEGYEGDAYECIERSGLSCACGPSAHCIDTAAGELICVCDFGYHGDGYICRPNFSCTNNSDCEYNAECRPDPNTKEPVCQCIEGYIKDQSDACIPDVQLCNGATCVEHASCLYDETVQVSYCHCDEGYEGDGILSCLPRQQTCEISNDCGANAVCSQEGATYRCVCLDGFTGDGYTCNPEINCKTNINLCDIHAFCIKTMDGYECKCNNGYTGNGNYCDLNPREAGNFLVASDGASVYRIPFTVSAREFATPLNSAIYQIAVGIDVDCLAGNIYWGDVGSSTIKRTSYDGSGLEDFLAIGVLSPEGVAIDWDARNIFWTDSKKLTIEVINIDTKLRKVLFENAGISNPRGIAVHPGLGKIFWSDWNRSAPKIEWANMDGSQRGVFLDQSEVKLPNSVSIDWARNRLCYSDAGLLIIKCVGIQNFHREIIAENCSYPFGLAISGDTFYWTDWKTRKIEYVNYSTQVKGQVPVATASRRLYGVAVVPDRCPDQRGVCGFRNGNCAADELCLPNGPGSRTCVNAV